MDSLNSYLPNSLKYIDNQYDSQKHLDNAFPGKKMFESECFIPNPNNINELLPINDNNIEKFNKSTNSSTLSSKRIEKYINKDSVGTLNEKYIDFDLLGNSDCETNLKKKTDEYNTLSNEKLTLQNEYNTLSDEKIKLQNEYNTLQNKYDTEIKLKEINNNFMENSLKKFRKKIYDDNNQMNANFENFTNQSKIDDLIQYNKELSEKQKVQKDKINLIKEKELSLEKTNELLKTSSDRNNFKKKVIYTLIALIFFLFILSLSTYIYFVRDFKVNK